MKFNLEKFIKEKIAINCKTIKQVAQLLNVLEKIDNSKSYLNTITDGYTYHSSDVCFRFISSKKGEQLITYSSIGWCIKNGCKIVNFDDLVFEDDLSGLVVETTNEVKGIIVKIGNEDFILFGTGKFKPSLTKFKGNIVKAYKPKNKTGLLEDILKDDNLIPMVEETDWAKIPVDTKVLCKDEDGWHRRYFAGVDDKGKPVVFYFGANSWTAGNNTTSNFPDIVLFEGNEHLLEGLDK